jgi:hypothetical protein
MMPGMSRAVNAHGLDGGSTGSVNGGNGGVGCGPYRVEDGIEVEVEVEL